MFRVEATSSGRAPRVHRSWVLDHAGFPRPRSSAVEMIVRDRFRTTGFRAMGRHGPIPPDCATALRGVAYDILSERAVMVEWVRALSGAVVVVAIAIRMGERRIVDALMRAGAVDAGTATELPLTTFIAKWHFRRLLNAGVAGETMMMRQYLKVVEYAEWRARRRRRALLVLPVVLALAAYVYFRTRAP